jgi:hypothetical protein
MSDEDPDGAEGSAGPEGSARSVPDGDGQPDAGSASPGYGDGGFLPCEGIPAKERAALLWFLGHPALANGNGGAWRLIVRVLRFAAFLILAAGVGIGLGDGNEFDAAGCSTAQKPVPACQRTHFAKTGGFGIGKTPGAGLGPAWGDDGVQDDKGPKRPEEVPDCAYREPDGTCKIWRLRCQLLAAAKPAPPIQNQKLRIQNSEERVRLGRFSYLPGFDQVWLGPEVFDLSDRPKARACIEYLVTKRALDRKSARHFEREIEPHVRKVCRLQKLPDYCEPKIQHYFNPTTGQMGRLGRELIKSAGRGTGRYYLEVT